MNARDEADALQQAAVRAAAGDRAALDFVLERVRPRVLHRCSRVLPYRQDAEDACQEALLAISRGIGGYDGRALFTTWAYQVATRAAFGQYHRMRRQSNLVATSLDGEGAAEPIDPKRVSVLAGARVDLVEALEKLAAESPLQSEAVMLRDVAELGYDEIAGQLGVAVGTVKSRVSHGRHRLRELLRA